MSFFIVSSFAQGRAASWSYNRRIRNGTLIFGIVDALEKRSGALADVKRKHFRLMKVCVLLSCSKCVFIPSSLYPFRRKFQESIGPIPFRRKTCARVEGKTGDEKDYENMKTMTKMAKGATSRVRKPGRRKEAEASLAATGSALFFRQKNARLVCLSHAESLSTSGKANYR